MQIVREGKSMKRLKINKKADGNIILFENQKNDENKYYGLHMYFDKKEGLIYQFLLNDNHCDHNDPIILGKGIIQEESDILSVLNGLQHTLERMKDLFLSERSH